MTPAELVLARLPDPKRNGRGWIARCPAHDDHTPSLSISEGDDGRALVHCHAGCTQQAVVATLGLTMQDLMPATETRSRPKRGAVTPPRVYTTAADAVAALERRHGPRSVYWTYADASGQPVGVVVRWDRPDGKDIRPVSRTSAGWVAGAMKPPRPLYRLPDLADARQVVVIEGEKAAAAARSIGLVATTSAGGAKAARSTDWSPLAGKQVVILPDNDQPGRDYARDVLACLSHLNPTPQAKVIDVPGLPEGGDVVAFIGQHDCRVEEEL